ncbi:MAG TPA: hypothetical protein PKY82_15290, partial [Pyrinomonadaceae bacterium]|nr:hypothetical protein [Pyrinomonadaceae bacterium]
IALLNVYFDLDKADLKSEMPTHVPSPEPIAPIAAEEIPVLETLHSPIEARVTDYSIVESSKTESSGHISQPELTAPSFLENVLADKKQLVSEPPPPIVKATNDQTSRKSKGIFWAIPIIASGILAVSGISGIIWFNGLKNPSVSNVNSNAATPTLTPNESSITVITTPTPKVSLTPAPNPSKPTPAPPKPTPTVNRSSGTKNNSSKGTSGGGKTKGDKGCIFRPEGCQ